MLAGAKTELDIKVSGWSQVNSVRWVWCQRGSIGINKDVLLATATVSLLLYLLGHSVSMCFL